MKYADYLEKHIFAPADMQDSGVDNDQQILKNRATGYSVGANGKLANAAWIDMTIPYAAGALYSTVEDLYRWDRALTGEKLLSAKSKELMYTPFKDGYAYGWMVQQAGGRKMIGHGGGVNGFATMIARYPEEDVCIVVLGNAERSPSGRLAADIAKILFGGSVPLPQERKEISMTVEQLDRYVGKYDMGPLKFEIKREGTNLIAYPSGQPPTRLAPMAEHRFFVTVVDAEFTFVMGDGGKAKELILHQGGRDMPAKRVE
jgi:CubicO group peptidase (beta-lactamase class C family)